MRSLTALATIALVSFGFASGASASKFKLSPASTKFTATGATTLVKGGVTVPCTANFKGATNAMGVGKVTAATFTGSALCTSITAGSLPWKAQAINATTANILLVVVNSPLGTCGPGTVPVTDNASGQLGFNSTLNPGACGVSGTLQTSPVITIVHK